jgi:imidazole glycerol-phosphate synthase subunit HisH
MIAIIDYGMGNLRSVEKALHKLGHAAEITSDPAAIAQAERVILPGVGAFGAAMANLERAEPGGEPLSAAVRDAGRSGKPVLGVCLGMQLFLSESEELGQHCGLDLVPGEVVKLEANGDPSLKVPHMGWNELRFPRESPLFAGLEDGASVYFVHSYYCRPEDPAVVAATCRHGVEFCAALSRDNLFATQFHPEKSGATGLKILDNFARL